MIFFTDENISGRLAQLIELFDQDHSVRAFKQWFEEGTPDVNWIRAVGGWDPRPIVLCGDGRILRNKVERAALKAAGLTFVFFAPGWTQMSWRDLAWKDPQGLAVDVQDVERALKPTIFTVTIQGKVQRTGLVSEL